MKRVAIVLTALLALGVSAACKPSAAAEPESATRKISVKTPDGPRDVVVHHPSDLDAKAPLVVVLHGGFGTPEEAEQDLGWDPVAEQQGFVVAYPEGHLRSWNVGPECCGLANRKGFHDAEFLHELIHQLAVTDNVDLNRVYAVGISNGAMMAYAWACSYPDDLAGIGPVAGSRLIPCDAAKPLAVVAVHGTQDQNVPISGGVGPKGVTGVNNPSLQDSLAPFLKANGCPAKHQVTDTPPVHQTEWTCANGNKVVKLVIDGAGHQWPGGRPPSLIGEELGLDRPYADFDATAFLWTQLSPHRR